MHTGQLASWTINSHLCIHVQVWISSDCVCGERYQGHQGWGLLSFCSLWFYAVIFATRSKEIAYCRTRMASTVLCLCLLSSNHLRAKAADVSLLFAKPQNSYRWAVSGFMVNSHSSQGGSSRLLKMYGYYVCIVNKLSTSKVCSLTKRAKNRRLE